MTVGSKTGLRAVVVSVDYADLLKVTMPYNRHHFDEVLVVTSTLPGDDETAALSKRYGADVFRTDLFFRDGAHFNKWRALEAGLDHFGRHGVLCLLDADVLWPQYLSGGHQFEPGHLYSPLRHMAPWPLPGDYVPLEATWKQYPIHRNVGEWAGYTQIFHADDPALGPAPWHQIDWCHAGGADSFFQQKWPPYLKVRTPWNVLHLGEAGVNWHGRATDYADGTSPLGSEERRTLSRNIWDRRRELRRAGENPFSEEKITPQ